MIVQCRVCGRVRIGTEWQRDDSFKPDSLGYCPPCLRVEQYANNRRFREECRRTERRAATGTLQATVPADAFEGFRRGE